MHVILKYNVLQTNTTQTVVLGHIQINIYIHTLHTKIHTCVHPYIHAHIHTPTHLYMYIMMINCNRV